jgi:hypothetical protein
MCSINHEKKAIFIHIPKTAGIYTRNVLKKYYGFDLYLFERPDHIEYCQTNINQNSNAQFYFGNKIHGIIQYYKTSEYLNKLMGMDEKKWNEYYKFCFVRDPYNRIISAWNYIQEIHKFNIDFDKYLEFKDIVSEDEYFHVFMPQYYHILDENNNIFVNYVGKFENLEEELKSVLIKIGFKPDDIIHNENKKNNREYNLKKNNLDSKTINIINDLFDKDFEYFNYKKI